MILTRTLRFVIPLIAALTVAGAAQAQVQVAARAGVRLPGDWVDGGAVAPDDRLDDQTLAARAEAWRPWRAYGAA